MSGAWNGKHYGRTGRLFDKADISSYGFLSKNKYNITLAKFKSQLFMLTDFSANPVSFLFWIAALFVSIAVHEFSHALVADRLGDPTARLKGRLTLNPFAHLDFIGTLFLFFFRIGWGKPVPVDPFNLRNPRRDMALVSLAGPASNLILAVLLSLLLRLLQSFALFPVSGLIFLPLIILNVSLAIFNLLPVYPLDGFKVVGGVLPENYASDWEELQSYGIIILLVFLFLPFGRRTLLEITIFPVINFILSLLIPGVYF